MNPCIVLDLDHSLGRLPGARVVPLEHWQETLRFCCTLRAMARFSRLLDDVLPADGHATVMLGSGDFHHLTWPLVRRMRASAPFQVVVLDNHPDNMRFPFGVHCGSWVRRVAMLPTVAHVHVVGITSADIGPRHAWENQWTPLRRGKLSYWSIGTDTRWAMRAGLGHAFNSFHDADALTRAFIARQRQAPRAAYLSIDKDVFAPGMAHTNWDQGVLGLDHARALIDSLHGGGLVGSDITGEISAYRYRHWWKRVLSALDAQPDVDTPELPRWQAGQHALNLDLLEAIAALPAAG